MRRIPYPYPYPSYRRRAAFPRRPLLLLVAALGGCAHYSAKALERSSSASSMIEQREEEGLYVAVKDLSSPRDALRLFDRDLVAYGYVPVLVLLELDRNAQATFDVQREDMKLCLRDGRRLTTARPEAVAEEASFSHFRSVLGFFFILPGFFIASSVNQANDAMEDDYVAKALENVRINPNVRSQCGVVFFEVPHDLRRNFTMEDAFVEMAVRLGGRAGVVGKVLEFPVHFGR
jgi:hypothetical protein